MCTTRWELEPAHHEVMAGHRPLMNGDVDSSPSDSLIEVHLIGALIFLDNDVRRPRSWRKDSAFPRKISRTPIWNLPRRPAHHIAVDRGSLRCPIDRGRDTTPIQPELGLNFSQMTAKSRECTESLAMVEMEVGRGSSPQYVQGRYSALSTSRPMQQATILHYESRYLSHSLISVDRSDYRVCLRPK